VLNWAVSERAARPLPTGRIENIQAEEARYGGGLLPLLGRLGSRAVKVTIIYHHLGVWKHEDTTVVRFGDHRILDELTVKKISEELLGVAAAVACRHLILNFSSVAGLSTLMLGKLLMLRKMMAAKGGRLLLCEIDPEIEYVFVETKLSHILEIMDTEADAVNACK